MDLSSSTSWLAVVWGAGSGSWVLAPWQGLAHHLLGAAVRPSASKCRSTSSRSRCMKASSWRGSCRRRRSRFIRGWAQRLPTRSSRPRESRIAAASRGVHADGSGFEAEDSSTGPWPRLGIVKGQAVKRPLQRRLRLSPSAPSREPPGPPQPRSFRYLSEAAKATASAMLGVVPLQTSRAVTVPG